MSTTILWFRQDLRLTDNPALNEAIRRGGRVVPLFIDASGETLAWRDGSASRWWLHHSLKALAADLERHGITRRSAKPAAKPKPAEKKTRARKAKP